MKIVAMIPARMGSKRIKKKNLRLLKDKPLISYIVEAAIQSECFDEIFINSEDIVFEKIATEHGISFYKRPQELASDSATNDDFTLDFMNNNECEVLVQLLPTSPFLTPEEISAFVSKMTSEDLDTLISVARTQIECVYDGRPINFDQKKQSPPSQLLTPINAYACGIMGWKSDNYKKNMKAYGCGYHGGDGKIDYFELKGYSTIDVDNEEDFLLAAAVLESRDKKIVPQYYGEEHSEVDVPSILKKDGVEDNDLHNCNSPIINVNELIANRSKSKSWSYRVVNSDSNSATLISQQPGEGNRRHYHPDWNEWWYIIDGTWEWDIEGEKVKVNKDDVVFIPKGKVHKITAVGNKPAIRLAVSREDVPHVYPEVENEN